LSSSRPAQLNTNVYPDIMGTKKILSVIGCFLLLVVSAGQLRADAMATAINGSASFFGSTSASGPSGNGLTTVSFNPDWVFLFGTGLYGSIPQTPATFAASFSFTGDGSGAVLSAPVTNLWTFSFAGNNYSFDLLSLTNGHVQSDAMAFSGTGTLFATGFDPTFATVGITGSGTSFLFKLSFVSNTAVPENAASATEFAFGLAMCGAMTWMCRRRPTVH
jgi:hypothetical protein